MTKVKNFLSLLLLMLWVLPTTLEAEERFYIESLNIQSGETKAFSINLDNENSYQGFQADIVLPEGLSIVTKANGDFDISLTDRASGSFSISSNEITKGTVRVVCYSSQNDVFSGQSGALVTMQIKASDSFRVGKLNLKNVIFSGLDNHDVKMSDEYIEVANQEGTYIANANVTYCGYSTDLTNQTVEITKTAENTYTVVYKSIIIGNTQFGDLTAEGVTGTISADGTVNYAFNGKAKITNINSEMADIFSSQFGFSEGSEIPFKMVGTSKAGILKAKFNVTIGGDDAVVLYNDYEEGKNVVITAKNATREYGDANPTLEYEVSGATLDGVPELECTAVANSPVGTYAINVRQGTVRNYNVTYVAGTLTVTKAPLTISAGAYSKKQGDAMPTFKATYSGFKNNETEEVLTKQPVFTTTATEASAPGEYAVTVSGAEATNYSITYEQGKLVVAAADAVIITAKNVTREYGDANPTLEYEVSGATLDGVPELECTAVANSPVGTYAITVKQGTVKNYNVTYVSGTLTVTKAPLTISAGTYSKKQGDAMPTFFKATYSGFKNNETEEVLSKKPVITTTATESSAPGEYAVTVSGAEATNYSITYEQGKLIVAAADAVIITAKNVIREYGEANPTLEYEVSGATLDGVPELECAAVANSPVGTYAINVRQGTVRNYNVTYVAGTLTVTKAPLTISAGTYSKKQGDAMPTFKATYSGFKNNETEEVLTKQPVFTTTATESSAPGEYAVTVSGAEATNYSITYEQGKLVVAAEDAVIITAKNVTREYGEANPTLEYEVSGATLDGVPELECTAVANSPVGTYAITVKQGTVKNYNVTYVSGTLTVTKAPLVISAGAYSKKQGDAMPTFKATYSGFKNNETEEVLTKQPVFTTTATETSEPGEYEVTVSGAETENYSITYEPGKLVVSASDPEPDPEPEERTDGTVVGTDGYQSAGASFVWDATIDWETQRLVASIDVSGCTGKYENLLSVGDKIEDWCGNHVHIYYTRNDAGTGGNVLVYYMNAIDAISCATFDMDGDDLRIIISKKKGITVNGKSFNYKFADYLTNGGDPITDTSGFYAALWALSDIQVGSQEGGTRSNATYNYIRVQDLVSPTEPDPEPDPEPEERKDGTVIGTDGYQPAGASFVWNASIDWETQKLVASIDVSTCLSSTTCENILSVGSDISSWADGEKFHIYYTQSSKTLTIWYIDNWEYKIQHKEVSVSDDVLRVEISKEKGLVVNGEDFNDGNDVATTYEELWKLSDIQVGSQEGVNRSNATYNFIRVQDMIKPDVPTAINAAALNGEADIYTLSGVKVNELQKGINIVRMNGKTMKIVKR